MSPDSCLSIHVSQDFCKIHVSGSVYKSMSSDSWLSIFESQDQDPCVRFMAYHSCLSIFVSQEPLQDPCLRIRMYLRILCKIHVSKSCLSIFISHGPLQDPFFGSMSQHLRISGSSARSMCPIHVLAFMLQYPFVSQDPLQDPCLRGLSIFVSQDSPQDPRLWAHISASLYLRLLCKIHVSGFRI